MLFFLTNIFKNTENSNYSFKKIYFRVFKMHFTRDFSY